MSRVRSELEKRYFLERGALSATPVICEAINVLLWVANRVDFGAARLANILKKLSNVLCPYLEVRQQKGTATGSIQTFELARLREVPMPA